MSLKILQVGTLGPMARIIIKETEVMAIRFNPVGEINLHGKILALSQPVRKMNFSSRKLAENQADSWQLAASSRKNQVVSSKLAVKEGQVDRINLTTDFTDVRGFWREQSQSSQVDSR